MTWTMAITSNRAMSFSISRSPDFDACKDCYIIAVVGENGIVQPMVGFNPEHWRDKCTISRLDEHWHKIGVVT